MTAMQQVPADHPLMKAWEKYRTSDGFRTAFKNGADLEYRTGVLWAAFMEGFNVATERAAGLHEQINPASDMERLDKVPGAGAMGAVIEYRDRIRAPQ
jgi:hypothetical protein